MHMILFFLTQHMSVCVPAYVTRVFSYIIHKLVAKSCCKITEEKKKKEKGLCSQGLSEVADRLHSVTLWALSLFLSVCVVVRKRDSDVEVSLKRKLIKG